MNIKTGSKALFYANNDLKKHANAEGQKAADDVNVKVKGATAEAASKLQDTIDQAKASLQSQLNKEQVATTAEIKQIIGNKIAEVRVAVNAANDQLIKTNEAAISATGQLLADGKSQLDGIIGSISK